MNKVISENEREWFVHFVGDRLSVPMNRSTAKKYLDNFPDADYMVKFKGKDKGRKIYKENQAPILFCEVFTCQKPKKVLS